VRSGRRLAIVAIGLLAIVGAAQEDPDAIVRGAVGARLDACAAGLEFNGTVLVARDGIILLARGYGLADPERRIPCRVRTLRDTPWVTMELIVAAVLCLVNAGRIALDDPIGDYLTGVPPDQEEITILQLLTHTSGLPEKLPGGTRRENAALDQDGAFRQICGLTPAATRWIHHLREARDGCRGAPGPRVPAPGLSGL